MDQSNLSKIIATLKIAYPYYFKELKTNEVIALATMYKENLSMFSYEVVNVAVTRIIKVNSFMPSIAEIVSECKKVITDYQKTIVDKMSKDNYFHSDYEITKILHFIDEGIIPGWFKEDMKKYGYKEEIVQIKEGENECLKLLA